MKKIFFSLIAMLFAYGCFAQQVKHVVFISVDGLRPDFYLDSSWHTKTMRNLMKNGTYAMGVSSVFPSMTYPAHTTIVTGVQPARHGIYYNNVFEPTGSTGKIYWNDSTIKVPTLWSAASAKGLKLASLFWTVSANAPVSWNIPDIDDMGDAYVEKYTKPAGFREELKTNVFSSAAKIEIGNNINIARIAAYVVLKERPNLMTIHFFAVDHAEHVQGRNGEMVKSAVSDADSGVAIIIDALKKADIWDNTVIMVGGDHGFVDVKTVVSPNVWLSEVGLANDVKKDDWKAQFFTVGGSAYLYVKNDDKQVLEQVKRILAQLPESRKKLFEIVDRKKIAEIGGNPEVALALTGLNGTAFGNAFMGKDVKAGHGGAHGYFPDFREIQTGFIAFGPGIKKGGVIPEMNLRDIAPVIAKLLGLSLPTAEGKIPAGLFSDQ